MKNRLQFLYLILGNEKMSPKFIIDEFGNKTEVILSINDFNELIEELEDLKDIKIREKDELIDHSKALELLGL
jgi:hypothetical protein